MLNYAWTSPIKAGLDHRTVSHMLSADPCGYGRPFGHSFEVTKLLVPSPVWFIWGTDSYCIVLLFTSTMPLMLWFMNTSSLGIGLPLFLTSGLFLNIPSWASSEWNFMLAARDPIVRESF